VSKKRSSAPPVVGSAGEPGDGKVKPVALLETSFASFAGLTTATLAGIGTSTARPATGATMITAAHNTLKVSRILAPPRGAACIFSRGQAERVNLLHHPCFSFTTEARRLSASVPLYY
jgi:hypothetical protein